MKRRSNPWRSMTDARLTYALKLLMVVVLAFYIGQFLLAVLWQVHDVIYVLIGAVFFAYLIFPLVGRLRRRMPLVAAIVIVYAIIALGLFGAAWFIVPRMVDEAKMLAVHYPQLIESVDRFVNDPHDPVTARLPPFVRNEIARVPYQLADWVKAHTSETFGHVVTLVAGTFAVVATFVLIPMTTAYLLLDLDNLKRGLSSVVPDERWRATLRLLSDFDRVIGGFIRGQLLVALSVGALITVSLAILRVPYAFLLGLLAALGDLIPYVGAVLAFIPAFVSAILAGGLGKAALVTVAFVAIFEAEGHFIAPNIVSRTVRLSPFAVLLALLIGAEVAGLIGALVAVPVAGVLRVIVLRVFHPPEPNEPQP
jgi:predicted PurR-regulated permease PerM